MNEAMYTIILWITFLVGFITGAIFAGGKNDN